MMPAGFWKWFDAELAERGWSERYLAEKADIANSVISKARNEVQAIGYDSMRDIAKALDVDERIALEKAGYLTPEPEKPTEFWELLRLLLRLPGRERRYFLDTLRLRVEQQEAEANESARPAKARR